MNLAEQLHSEAIQNKKIYDCLAAAELTELALKKAKEAAGQGKLNVAIETEATDYQISLVMQELVKNGFTCSVDKYTQYNDDMGSEKTIRKLTLNW